MRGALLLRARGFLVDVIAVSDEVGQDSQVERELGSDGYRISPVQSGAIDLSVV